MLLQLGIERRTNDVDSIYQRAYSNATKYEKIFKQTVQLGPLTERSVMKTPLTDWNSLRASA
ncbi:hypothetical protein D3C74_460200 [compost metagenome]